MVYARVVACWRARDWYGRRQLATGVSVVVAMLMREGGGGSRVVKTQVPSAHALEGVGAGGEMAGEVAGGRAAGDALACLAR